MADKVLLFPYCFVDEAQARADKCVGCNSDTHLRRVALRSLHPGGIDKPAGKITLCAACIPSLDSINAEFQAVINGVGNLIPNIIRRWLRHDHQLQLGEPKWDVEFPIAVFSLLREARRAFIFGSYLACVAQAGSAVEAALNVEARLAGQPWRMLGRALKDGLEKGLPITELCESHEASALRPFPNMFVNRRNKAAHGEISAELPSGVMISPELVAADQLHKAQRFLIVWAASPANPVARGRGTSNLLFAVPANALAASHELTPVV